MESTQVGKSLPEPIKSEIEKMDGGRAFATLSESGTLELFIVMDELSPNEEKALSGDLTLVFRSDLPVPMVVLLFNGLTFGIPLLLPSPPSGADTMLYFVAKKREGGGALRHARILKLNKEVFQGIAESIRCYPKTDVKMLVDIQEFYLDYARDEIIRDGIRQDFRQA